MFQIVRIQAHFNAIQQVGNQFGVSADGDALIQRVEVVIVKGQAHWQTFDDERRKILTVTPPLLLGIALDEFLVNVASHKRNRLLFEVLRLMGDFLTLLLNLSSSLFRCHNAPHLVEGVHIEGQRVEFTLVVGDRRVRETVELSKLRDVFPNFFIIGMENVGPVLVDVDAFDVFSINVTCNVGTFVYNENAFVMSLGFVGENCTVQARAYY